MKHLRKYKFSIAALFVACFLSAFTIKTSHSLEAHSKAFVCENHEDTHFHGNVGEDSACCPICDFFFSPFSGQIIQQEVTGAYFTAYFISIPVAQTVSQFVSFLYSLRAPPL